MGGGHNKNAVLALLLNTFYDSLMEKYFLTNNFKQSIMYNFGIHSVTFASQRNFYSEQIFHSSACLNGSIRIKMLGFI